LPVIATLKKYILLKGHGIDLGVGPGIDVGDVDSVLGGHREYVQDILCPLEYGLVAVGRAELIVPYPVQICYR